LMSPDIKNPKYHDVWRNNTSGCFLWTFQIMDIFFRDMMACNMVDVHRFFGVTCSLLLRGLRVCQANNIKDVVRRMVFHFLLFVPWSSLDEEINSWSKQRIGSCHSCGHEGYYWSLCLLHSGGSTSVVSTSELRSSVVSHLLMAEN
jgi:hypothetical protein